MERKIIKIDHDKCNGCGLCIPNCPEGAIQMIDGKARLVSDLFCDGLGACIGHCPEGAISTERREADEYDETKVIENIIEQGPNVIKAHLEHLREHGEEDHLARALEVMEEKGIDVPEGTEDKGEDHVESKQFSGCPGAMAREFSVPGHPGDEPGKRSSRLRQWPVQLHLVPPNASFFRGKDVILAADCVAYALADFHKDHLEGKALAIACPKLDADREVYVEKIKTMIDEARINTLTVMIMEVPCCGGLSGMVSEAASRARRKVPVKLIVVGMDGSIKSEEWAEV